MANIHLGDTVRASVAACVENVQKRTAKSGNKYAFVGLSDAYGAVEAMIFADGLTRYENVLTSGLPVWAKLTIDKQDPEKGPRIKIDELKNLDTAIAEQAKGAIIYISGLSAVSEVKKILSADKKGANKVYIIPEIKGWDVRIELEGGFAFYDTNILSKLRAVNGVSDVKEI